MAMLADLLKSIISDNRPEGGGKDGDHYMEKPPSILENEGKAVDSHMNLKTLFGMNGDDMNDKNSKDAIYNDSGSFSTDQTNPFLEALQKSRAGGPGVLRQLIDSFMGGSGVVPHTGTVGGGGPADHVPGTRQDAVLNPTPLKSQRQPNLTQVPSALPTQVPPDYSMPQALDPNSIEELRLSLLTDAGQLDPNNPNGLSGRMNSPNASIDQRNQMNDAQRQHDSLRGFDGSRSQRIKESNNGGQ